MASHAHTSRAAALRRRARERDLLLLRGDTYRVVERYGGLLVADDLTLDDVQLLLDELAAANQALTPRES